MSIGLKKSYWLSSSHHLRTVARLCNQFNHVFAVLISIPHFTKINFYQTRPELSYYRKKIAKSSRAGALPPDRQWFPAAGGSALNPKAQPFHYKFLASSQC